MAVLAAEADRLIAFGGQKLARLVGAATFGLIRIALPVKRQRKSVAMSIKHPCYRPSLV